MRRLSCPKHTRLDLGQARSESDSTLTINGSERDSEITDCFESSVSESESSDDGSVQLRVMLAFLFHALK
ncbi:hypothetical protein TNCV_4539761 [Trichonephila clavipes]|nr:hypothetical protein TNCV_4539761 [Trichonephila clavipes]